MSASSPFECVSAKTKSAYTGVTYSGQPLPPPGSGHPGDNAGGHVRANCGRLKRSAHSIGSKNVPLHQISLYQLRHKALKPPEVAVAYPLGFEVRNRVEQVLGPRTPVTAGPGQNIGNCFK